MAFSTQKEFFHVPFMNETVDYECRRACVKLKTYQSTIDDRSWAMDETLQSRFLSDLITCQTPVGGFGDGNGDGDDYNYDSDGAGTSVGAQSGRPGYGQGAGRGGGGRGAGRGGGRGGGGRGRGEPGGKDDSPYNTVTDDSGYAGGAGMGADALGAQSSAYGRGGGGNRGGGPDGVGAGVGGTGKEERGGGGPGGALKGDRSGVGPGGAGPGGGTGGVGTLKGERSGVGPGGAGPGGGTGGGGPGGSRGGGPGGGFGGAGRFGQSGLVSADSVIACATEHLGRFEELLSSKKNLEKKLEVSNERLKVLNMENEKIKSIMNDKFDSNHAKDFYNKIQKLTSSGKISKSEENELLQIYNKFEDMNKAYEILQAENAYLKRLMEKLSLRATYEAIKTEPEKSTDIGFLQKEVTKLRQEVTMLRKYEDEKLKGSLDSNRNKMTDQDAETLKAIIKERNALREKCNTLKDLESKVQQLQRIAREADKMSDSLSNDLDTQARHVFEMEHEMKQMQEYYEDQISKLRFNEELLKCQLDEMKEDLIRAKCVAQKTECLQLEVGSLRNEVMRRDIALNDYDCQYKQLMNVIDELQGNAIQNLHDTQTQTCTDYMDDLTFFARATLSEIKKELKKRGADGDKIGGGGYFGGPAITDGLSPDECCAELRRMQDIVRKLTQENEYLQNNVKDAADELCADTLKKLKELEERCKSANDEITYLKKDKDDLNINAMQKLNEFSDRVDKLGADVSKTAKDTAGMDKDLKESIKLVKDISDIQLKNTQLTNAVNAISTRDDQRALDDLRRQLLEEQAKNKQCQEDNKNLREALVQRGIDPDKAVKEIVKQAPPSSPAAGREGTVGAPGAAKTDAGPEDAQKRGAGAAETGAPDAVKVAGAPDAKDVGGPEAARKGAPDTFGPDAVKKVAPGGPDAVKKGGADASQAGGSDAAKKGEAGPTGADAPGAAKKDGTAPVEAGRPDAAKKGETGAPDATKKSEPDAAKKPDAAKTAEPDAAKKPDAAKTAEPDAAKKPDAAKQGVPDAAKPGEPEAAKKGVPDAAKPGEPDAAKKGEPDAAKKAVPETAKKGEPDAAKKAEPEAAKKGAPDAAKKGEPDAGRKGAPDAAKKGEPDAARKGAPDAAKKGEPDAARKGAPDAAKKDEPAAGQGGEPDATKKGEPGAGPRPGAAPGPGADAAKQVGPAAARAGAPDAVKKDEPAAGETPAPDAVKKGPPAVGFGGVADDGAPAGGEDGAPDTSGPGADATATGGPEAGVPGAGGPGKQGPTATGPGGAGTGAPDVMRPDGVGPAGRAGDGAGVGVTGDRTAPGQGVGGAGAARPGAASGRGVGKVGSPASGIGKLHPSKDPKAPADDAFQQFVDVNATAMMTNIKAGSALEKELRAILNAFMMECGFCFCKSLIPKSKFYALCHKLLHNGIQCMAFRELAYMHRKIFMAADKLHPGCLLNMILTEQGFKDGENFKCCFCKNALCCSNSEEMLKEKVCKLERDIEMAKEYLDSLKSQPKTPKSPYTARGKTYRQMEDRYSEAVEELLTCREAKPVLSKSHNKQMKTLKARIMKCSELLR